MYLKFHIRVPAYAPASLILFLNIEDKLIFTTKAKCTKSITDLSAERIVCSSEYNRWRWRWEMGVSVCGSFEMQTME